MLWENKLSPKMFSNALKNISPVDSKACCKICVLKLYLVISILITAQKKGGGAGERIKWHNKVSKQFLSVK